MQKTDGKKVYDELTNMIERQSAWQLHSEQCGHHGVWPGIGHFCWTSTRGTELEGKLGTEENRNQRIGEGLVIERNGRTQ